MKQVFSWLIFSYDTTDFDFLEGCQKGTLSVSSSNIPFRLSNHHCLHLSQTRYGMRNGTQACYNMYFNLAFIYT